MSKITRTIACLVAFCLMLGGIALAEDFGIGEAAVHEPVVAVEPASNMNTESLSQAKVDTPASSGTMTISLLQPVFLFCADSLHNERAVSN